MNVTSGDGIAPYNTLLRIEDLQVVFKTRQGMVRAVNGLSYEVQAGEIVAILGESGSGKSVSARAIMGLVPDPPGIVVGGKIFFKGDNLLELPAGKVRQICGKQIALVPQDPLTAFNPLFPVGWQIGEVFRVHKDRSSREIRHAVVDLMRRVHIPEPETRVDEFPFQFSGGMRQRALIGMALALNPDLLIADEPTTALDVTTQAQILDLLVALQADYGMGLILITHDIGVVAEIAQRVVVMYAGRAVETGPTIQVLAEPAHPYTRGLKDSLPRLASRQTRLLPVSGAPPDLANIPNGCPFHPRCQWAQPGLCDQEEPELRLVNGRYAACHFAEKVLQDVNG